MSDAAKPYGCGVFVFGDADEGGRGLDGREIVEEFEERLAVGFGVGGGA